MIRSTHALVAAGAAAAVFGCSSNNSSSPSTGTTSASTGGAGKTGAIVAHVGDGVITSDEVKARLGEQAPFIRKRYEQPAQKLEFLQNMVKFEILSQEAVKEGLDKSPEAEQSFKRMLVQELIRKYYEKTVDVTDDDLKKYYDKHIDEYVKPEKVRLQHIFFAGASDNAKARAEAKAKANKILAQLKAEEVKAVKAAKLAQAAKPPAPNAPPPPPPPLPIFTDLAKANSDDPGTKNLGGDIRFQSQDELGKAYSPEFAAAAFALKTEAPMTQTLIETPKGFHIARLLSRQNASSQTFDDPKFKDTLKERYLAETRSARFEEYYQGLKKAANVQVDDKALAAVEIPDTPAPAGTRPGPVGTGMPMGAGGSMHPPMAPPPMGRPGGLPPGVSPMPHNAPHPVGVPPGQAATHPPTP